MGRLSARQIREFLQEAEQGATTTQQGRALENLICYVFGAIPGIEVVKRNVLNAFNTEEIDVAFWNAKRRNGLEFLPNIILVECKNWSRPVGTDEVAYFVTRLQSRGRDFGILVAARGITGDPLQLTGAHFEIARALAQGCCVVVITRGELEGLRSTEELARLIKEKLCEITVAGTIAANG